MKRLSLAPAALALCAASAVAADYPRSARPGSGRSRRRWRTEISGDFNSAYTVKVTSHRTEASGMMPADTTMTMNAKWAGACKTDQKPGDMIMPDGMKMNVKDLQNIRSNLPK